MPTEIKSLPNNFKPFIGYKAIPFWFKCQQQRLSLQLLAVVNFPGWAVWEAKDFPSLF